ncbi:MAG: 3D domain-containing protein [Candidatus Muiribacteriota bacterium]
MKYLFVLFITIFTFMNFFYGEPLVAESNDNQNVFFAKNTIKIEKNDLTGVLSEYYKVKRDHEGLKKILIWAKFDSEFVYWDYRNEKSYTATAYTPGPESCGIYADGYTFTEAVADYGMIAVDPRKIPLGSLLWVEDYGFAMATDVGGKIKGNRIDLCFPDVDVALKFGVRQKNTVTISKK